jgi:hypothetical protein
MGIVQVDAVCLEAAERVLTGAEDVVLAKPLVIRAVTHRVVDLGGEEHSVSLARFLQKASDDTLAFARIVAIGCVKDVYAGIQGCLHDALGFFL